MNQTTNHETIMDYETFKQQIMQHLKKMISKTRMGMLRWTKPTTYTIPGMETQHEIIAIERNTNTDHVYPGYDLRRIYASCISIMPDMLKYTEIFARTIMERAKNETMHPVSITKLKDAIQNRLVKHVLPMTALKTMPRYTPIDTKDNIPGLRIIYEIVYEENTECGTETRTYPLSYEMLALAGLRPDLDFEAIAKAYAPENNPISLYDSTSNEWTVKEKDLKAWVSNPDSYKPEFVGCMNEIGFGASIIARKDILRTISQAYESKNIAITLMNEQMAILQPMENKMDEDDINIYGMSLLTTISMSQKDDMYKDNPPVTTNLYVYNAETESIDCFAPIQNDTNA